MQKNYLLIDEYEALLKKKSELQTQMDEIGVIIGEITTQSWETWHDNAGYDEAVRTMGIFTARNSEINTLLNSSKVITETEHQGSSIQIWSWATIELNWEIKEILVWGAYPISWRISYLSPLGQAIIGKGPWDESRMNIGNKEYRIKIVELITNII